MLEFSLKICIYLNWFSLLPQSIVLYFHENLPLDVKTTEKKGKVSKNLHYKK